MPLTTDEVKALLLAEVRNKKSRVSPQIGPLRRFDTEMRCASRGCGSSTYFKVQSVPMCNHHALIELNEMLVECGFKGYVHHYFHQATPIPKNRIMTAATIARLDLGWALEKFECLHGIRLDQDCKHCEHNG